MDWSTAKNILIVVFLILNIFLFIILRPFYFNQGIPESVLSNTVKIMASKDVVIKCEIPKTTGKYMILKSSTQALQTEKLTKLLFGKTLNFDSNNEIQLGSKTMQREKSDSIYYKDLAPTGKYDFTETRILEREALLFIEKMGEDYENFVFDSKREISPGKFRIRYVEKFQGYLVFRNYLEFIYSGKGIEELILAYKKPDSFSNRRENIKNAYEVLLNNSGSLRGNVITSMDLGFMSESEDSVYKNLVWRIKTQNNTVYYFDAYYGTKV